MRTTYFLVLVFVPSFARYHRIFSSFGPPQCPYNAKFNMKIQRPKSQQQVVRLGRTGRGNKYLTPEPGVTIQLYHNNLFKFSNICILQELKFSFHKNIWSIMLFSPLNYMYTQLPSPPLPGPFSENHVYFVCDTFSNDV